MAACNNAVTVRRHWFVTLSLAAAVGVVAVGVVLWQAVGLSSLPNITERVAVVKPYSDGLRFALIGLLALTWPRLPAFWTRASGEDDRKYARWMSLRWRVVGWLLVIELVIGQNLIGRCFAATTGPTV